MAPCFPGAATAQPADILSLAWAHPEVTIGTENDVKLLTDYILRCPYVSKDSPVIAAALSGLGTEASLSPPHKEEKLISSPAQHAMAPTKKTPFVRFPTLLRALLLDSPLMIIFGVCMSLFWVRHVHDNYLVPQLEAAEWTEERQMKTDLTYYTRPCFQADMSTDKAEDLVLSDTATPQEAYEHQLRHGFTVFPDVLSEETVRNLRQHINSRNRNLTAAQSNFVIANENRFSYSLGTEEPFVAEAMTELTTNERLKASVEKIMGKNPALIEMTAITSSYGAVAQTWHDDVVPEASPVQHARAFGPSYSIFVVLQNTTKEMGATDACPGLHMCAAGPIAEMCQENGFQVVGEHGYWKAGDALLMNMNSWHRGAAHTDPNAPDRVMLILTFVPQPRSHAESRQMSQGITFSLRWDMWGHTWNDLSKAATAMTQPWATLRALGLYKEKSADWGIDYVSGSSMRMANEDNGFRRDELIDFVHRDGGFKFLPSWLHGDVGDDEETSWHEFLVDTLSRCEQFMIRVSAGSVGAYTFLYLLVGLVSIGMKGDIKGGLRQFGLGLLRLCIMLSIVFALYFAAVKHVDSTQWASDLRRGLRYTSPFGNEESRFYGPTVFPHRNDVLIETRFKSKYLAMYNDYVGNHPGNRVYNELVDEKASTYASYKGLPSAFIVAVADYIVGALYSREGRFLYQNPKANFVKISIHNAVAYTIQELATKSNAVLKNVLQELDFLISEAKYGHLRDSLMSKQYTFQFLLKLQSRLLLGSFPPSVLVVRSQEANQRSNHHFQLIRTVALPTSLGERSKPPRRSVVLNVGKAEESPFAYLEAGKIVDVKYTSRGRAKKRIAHWYKALIYQVSSTGNVHVVYPDSEDSEDVDRLRIRPYIAPRVGEMVEVEIEDEYEDGTIIEAKSNGLYDVEVDGEVIEDISDATFRRK